MLYQERFEDQQAAHKAAISGRMAGVWTSGPGIVQSFDAADCTATVQPATQGVIKNPDNSLTYVNLPLLQKCPVQFPGGGGMYLTSPVKQGDECLVVFASRCIDAWWANGGVQAPLVFRMHDLSDGFCIPGVFSVPNVLPNISTSSMQLRTKNVVMMDVTESQITMNVKLVNTVDVYIPTGSLLHHEHTYSPGSGSPTPTSPPIQGT